MAKNELKKETIRVNDIDYTVTLIPAFTCNTIAIQIFNIIISPLLSSGLSLKNLDKDNVMTAITNIYLPPLEVERILKQLFENVYVNGTDKLSECADYHFIKDLFSMYEVAYEVMNVNGFFELFTRLMEKTSKFTETKKNTSETKESNKE